MRHWGPIRTSLYRTLVSVLEEEDPPQRRSKEDNLARMGRPLRGPSSLWLFKVTEVTCLPLYTRPQQARRKRKRSGKRAPTGVSKSLALAASMCYTCTFQSWPEPTPIFRCSPVGSSGPPPSQHSSAPSAHMPDQSPLPWPAEQRRAPVRAAGCDEGYSLRGSACEGCSLPGQVLGVWRR